MANATIAAPGMNPLDILSSTQAAKKNISADSHAKAKAAAQDFESVFINTMFQQMFTGTEGDGPLGGNGATGVWRSFLIDEHARNFSKAGGLGIAKQVYDTLLAQQGAQ